MAKKEKKKETTGEMLRSLGYALLIALVFRSLAYEPFHIPSGSMQNTLQVGDYIFVSKLSYGYSRYSFPFGIDWFEGRKFFSAPERGDIVVFRLPTNPKVDYIKRLIGLPGDRVQMRDGRLYINGERVKVTPGGTVAMGDADDDAAPRALELTEYLPGGRSHAMLDTRSPNIDASSGFDTDNTPEYTVPEDHYFMMGDNRDHSQDSRFLREVGFVPVENLVGRAEVIAVSFKGGVPLWKFWQWPNALRNDRWFTSLDDK